MSTNTNQIVGFESRFLDVLRAVAVLGVVTAHTSQWIFSGIEVGGRVLGPVSNILAAGRYGVPVFFFLSGYLLSAIYGAHNHSVTFRGYVFSRLGRVWPLWILFSLVWSGFFLIAGESTDWILTGFLLSTLFLLWVSPLHFDSFIGGAWSIQIEIVLYALFFILRKRGWVLILLCAIAVNLAGSALSFASLDGTNVFDAMRRLTLQSGVNFFVMGVLASRFIDGKRGRFGSGVEFESTASKKGLEFAPMSLILLWLSTFLFAPYYGGSPVEALGFLLTCLLVASAITSNKRLGAAISWLGKRSYFVFFMHFFVLATLPSSPFETSVSSVLALPVVLLSVIAISYAPSELSYRYFESPMRKKFRNF